MITTEKTFNTYFISKDNEPLENGSYNHFLLDSLAQKYGYLHEEKNDYNVNFEAFLHFVYHSTAKNLHSLLQLFSESDDYFSKNSYNGAFSDKIFVPVSEKRFFTSKEKKLLKEYHLSQTEDTDLTEADIDKFLEKDVVSYIDYTDDIYGLLKGFPIVFIVENYNFDVPNRLTFFFKKSDDNQNIENCLIIPFNPTSVSPEQPKITFYGSEYYYIKCSEMSIDTISNCILYQSGKQIYSINDKIKMNIVNDVKKRLTEADLSILKELYIQNRPT